MSVLRETKQGEQSDGTVASQTSQRKPEKRTDTLMQETVTIWARDFQATGMASAKDLRQSMSVEHCRRGRRPVYPVQGE